ncbi:MAG: zinc ribbon domain-containing protein [Gemmatimonadaceae bacterium]
MHPDLQVLIALQRDGVEVDRIEKAIRDLSVREVELDRERTASVEMIQRLRSEVEVTAARNRELQNKIDEHRRTQERSLAHVDHIRKARDANAAKTEMDLVQRVLAADEKEQLALNGRVADLLQNIDMCELELAEIDERQFRPRADLAVERKALAEGLAVARAKRGESAVKVTRSMLAKYERIRTRGPMAALVPVRDGSCGRCHMAIPMQRRSAILAGNSIESCEGCGVLLHAAE